MSEIVVTPSPVLKQTAKPVQQLDKKVINIITDMLRTLEAAKNPEGVGLAAPQIGISLRIFVMKPTRRSKPKIIINPEITNLSKESQSPDENDGVYEGCLSIPHHYAPISRSMSLTLTYQTLAPNLAKKFQSEHAQPDPASGAKRESSMRDWNSEADLIKKTEDFTGFTAHIIQHEVDHLNGILFTDHVLEQNTKLYRIKGKTWEEVDL